MRSWNPTTPPHAQFKAQVFQKAAKVTSFIYQIGEVDFLRRPSKEVPIDRITSSEYRTKISYLTSCLRKYRTLTGRGRAISAVQVGIPERFAAMYVSKTKLRIIINPRVTKRSTKQYRYPEMCMSANPIIAPIVRPAWIEFTYYDEDGLLKKWRTKDTTKRGRMLNRVFQHEIDHMDGIINIDLVKDPKELILESDPDFYKKAAFEGI